MTTAKKMVLAGVFTVAMVGVMFALKGGDEGNAVAKTPPDNPKPNESAAAISDAKPKYFGKTISLVEAIAIAEKTAKGRAVKAELKEKPDLSFKVEVMTWDGNKSKIELNADGSVRANQMDDKKSPGEKEKKGKKGGERSRD